VPAATTAFLVRHAAHDRVGSVLCGRMPGVALGEEGRRQAARLAERLARERIAAVHTSPVERAAETAAPIARRLGLTPRPCAAITEIDFGAWTGLGFDALRDDPAWHRWNERRGEACPPGGEAMTAVQARAVRHVVGLREAHPGSGVVLVSHGDVIKAIVAWCLGLPLDAHARFDVAPASVSALVLWDGGAKLLSLNEVPG
jgi:probable phosphoglycerate mutase